MKNPKSVLETGIRIIETGTGIIVPTFRLLIKKLLLQNIFNSQKQNIKTGNRIIETGNGIIFPTYRLLIKKLLLRNNFYLTWGDPTSTLGPDLTGNRIN